MTTLKNPKFDDLIAYVREKLIVKYESSADLKTEFVCGADYAAFELNSATARPLVRGWKAGFDAQAAETAIAAVEARRNVREADARRAAGRHRIAH